MKSNIILTTIALTTLFLTSCATDQKNTTITNDSTPVNVVLNSNSNETSKNTLNTSGKIEASKSAILSTRMMGYVEKINVNIGDKVSKGQSLIQINSSDLIAKKAQVIAKIKASESALKNAKKDFDRYTNLFQKQSVSQKELDDVTTQYEMTKSNLQAAKAMKNEIEAQLKYTLIKAPFSGVITQKLIKEGNMANPGMPLVSIENSEKLQVTTLISESDIHNFNIDSSVSLHVKSINKKVQGKIISISKSSTNSAGQFAVKINLQKPDSQILSGMYTTIEIETNTNTSNKVTVPLSAIITKGQLSGVYTVSSNDTAILRWLRLGKKTETTVEVLSGLNADEKYIVKSSGKLYNGVKVSIQ